jgi:hypothetical protein
MTLLVRLRAGAGVGVVAVSGTGLRLVVPARLRLTGVSMLVKEALMGRKGRGRGAKSNVEPVGDARTSWQRLRIF